MSQRILIAQSGFLGDVILTSGLMSAARAHFPGATIGLLAAPPGAALMADQPFLDLVVVDDKRNESRTARGWFRLVSRLRAQRFTVGLVSHKSLRTALLMAAAGIERRVGFRRWPQALLYHERVPYDTSKHYAHRQLELLRPFGFAGPAAPLALGVSEAKRREAEDILYQAGARSGRCLVGICPGSAWVTKRWPAERYGLLAKALAARGITSVIIGGKEDAESARAVQDACGASAVDLTGKTPIGLLPALLERMDLVVTNDSAPMHVASALGRPLVAIFCSTAPSQGYAPLSPGAVVIGRELDCRPCGRHGHRHCPLGTDACRLGIGVEEVAEAVSGLLGKVEQGGAGRQSAAAGTDGG